MDHKKTYSVIIGIMLSVVFFAGCGKKHLDTVFPVLDDNKADGDTFSTEEEGLEEIPFENPELVDYMWFANYLEWSDVSYWGENPEVGPDAPACITKGFEIRDIDSDEDEELLVLSLEPDWNNNGNYIEVLNVFDADASSYAVWKDTSAAGDSHFVIDDSSDKTYIEKTYSTKYFYNALNIWTSQGWKENSVLEKEDQTILQSKWEGVDVLENEWLNQRDKISERDIYNDLENHLFVKTDATAKTTANTLKQYFSDKGIDTYLFKKNENEYYVVPNNYLSGTWVWQYNEDMNAGMPYFDFVFGDISWVFGIKSDITGTIVSVIGYIPETEVVSIEYSDGFLVKTNTDEYLYRDQNGELIYIAKLSLSDMEEKLVSNNWYMIDRYSNMDKIIEFQLYENATGICTTYSENLAGNWMEEYCENCTYTYDETNQKLVIGCVQYGYMFTYDGYGFIEDTGIDSYYGKYLLGYGSFPDYDILKDSYDKKLKELSMNKPGADSYEQALDLFFEAIDTNNLGLAKKVSMDYFAFCTWSGVYRDDEWNINDCFRINTDDTELIVALKQYENSEKFVGDDYDYEDINEYYYELASEYYEYYYGSGASQFTIDSMVAYTFRDYNDSSRKIPIIRIFKIDGRWYVDCYIHVKE